MIMTQSTYNNIKNTIGSIPPENGGIIGIKDGIVCAFFYDSFADNSENEYHPCVYKLNEIIDEWSQLGISFCGIIHSHHNDAELLSRKDIVFARRILALNNLNNGTVFFPIVHIYSENIFFTIKPFIVSAEEVVLDNLIIKKDHHDTCKYIPEGI